MRRDVISKLFTRIIYSKKCRVFKCVSYVWFQLMLETVSYFLYSSMVLLHVLCRWYADRTVLICLLF